MFKIKIKRQIKILITVNQGVSFCEKINLMLEVYLQT